MPKPPSDKLFNLIHSLSGSELRYISLHLPSATKSNKYLVLFQSICKQNEQDEGALILKVYQGEPVTSKKFAQLKAYLFNTILRLLQDYDEDNSITFKVSNQLQQISVLFNRSKYKEASELLKKTKKTVLQYELFLDLIALLDWEKQIAYAQEDILFLDNELERIDQEEQMAVTRIRNISTYRNMLYRLIISRRKHAVLRSEEKQQKINTLLQHKLLHSTDKALSHRAKILYYRILSNAAYSISNYENFYNYSREQIELMESNPALLKEDISAYIYGMTNLMLACGLLKKHTELQHNLLKFRKLKGKSRDDNFRIFKHYNTLTFRMCIESGAFKEGDNALKKHLKEIKKYPEQSQERGSFYFQYFYIHFGNSNYDEALNYLNLWLNLPRSIERKDLQSLARMLNLIIHYEMKNYELVFYLIKSTKRYLRSRNRAFEFEKSLLQFFQKAIKPQNKKTLLEALKKLKLTLTEVSEKPSEKVMLQYFDFMSWIDSKIENRPFSKVVADRYRGI